MTASAPALPWRRCLATGLLLSLRAAAQPICSVVEAKTQAASGSRCGVSYSDLPTERRLSARGLMSSWAPASVYRAAASHPSFQASSANALIRSLDSHGPSVSIGGRGPRDLPASAFEALPPHSDGLWANTAEGEWMAILGEAARSGAAPAGRGPSGPGPGLDLEDAEGNCSLAGISVYQSAPRTIVARLNFDHCSHLSGVRHAAVVVPIHSSVFGTSRLVDWMCALMPHETCFRDIEPPASTTQAPGVVAMHLAAKYSYLGHGQCQQAPGGKHYAHTQAVTLGECAQECLSENTVATRAKGGTSCTGFAFSESSPQHCVIYMEAGVSGAGAAASDWSCFRMLGATGDASHRAGGLGEAEERAARATIRLSLSRDLGVKGMAVRRRLTSLAPDCYEPFDWIDLSHAARHPLHARFGDAISVNHTMFERLVQRLPVVELAQSESRDGSSAIGTDSVCIDAGTGACGRDTSDVWQYLNLALASVSCLAVGFLLGRRGLASPESKYLQLQITDANGNPLPKHLMNSIQLTP